MIRRGRGNRRFPQVHAPDIMQLASLFWFYKDLDVCAERLSSLRRQNPDTPIYGLFGGRPEDAPAASAALSRWLDDLYIYPKERDALWKWQHGDQLIAAWHRDRGHALPWDTVFVTQWDMLLLEPLDRLFASLKPGEALFSGLRPAHEVEAWWGWLNGADETKRRDRDAFLSYMDKRYGFRGELLCCLFIVACLPRRFLDLYVEAGPPEAGFLEYKMPTMARQFGIPFCTDHPYRPWWRQEPATRDVPIRARLLNAVGDTLPREAVLEELARPGGLRIIHPYRGSFPL